MALKAYNDSSIRVLKNIEHVRTRPTMYIGSVSEKGLHHLLSEILDNATDEATSGEATSINVIAHKDGSITVSDNGRGIPVGIHPTEKIPTPDVVFTMLNAGGKFGGDESAFECSVGLNGVGASIVCFLSKWVDVRIRREGKEYYRRYENGIPTEKELKIVSRGLSKKDTGTAVTFFPDLSIFKDVKGFNKESIVKRLRELAYLNSGVQYKLIWETENQPDEDFCFKFENGIKDYISFITKEKKLLHNPIHIESDELDSYRVKMSFAYDSGYETETYSYANNVNTHEHGIHINAAMDSLAKTIEEIANKNGLLKGLEATINKSDVVEGLNLIVSVTLSNPEFEGQTKGRLNNEEIRKPLGDFLYESLTKEFKKNKDIGKIIASRVVETIHAKEAAKKARTLNKKGSANSLLAGKLTDCSSKHAEICEIFICEGDSAGGTTKDARDRKTQAVLPIKGKILNTHDVTLNAALENKEIASIISALGVRLEKGHCDLTDLKYHKVILACDEDVDGGHIRCLLATLFYKFMRPLIEKGHLYIADLPLYRVIMGMKVYYLKDDKAMEEFKIKNINKKMEISRFKGLGEMDVKDFKELAMAPSTRNMKQVTISDIESTTLILQQLMGEDAKTRKEFLMEHLNFKDI